MLNKVEVEILQHMLENKLINEINSRTIRNISKGIEINYFRTRNYVNHLKLLGLLDSGFKELNSGTFYITKKGVEIINEKTWNWIKNKININQ